MHYHPRPRRVGLCAAHAALGARGAGAPVRTPRVELRRLAVTAGITPSGAKGPAEGPATTEESARERLSELLELLLQRSAPAGAPGGEAPLVAPADGGPLLDAGKGGPPEEEGEPKGAPRWTLRCRREGELHELTFQMLCSNARFLKGVRARLHNCHPLPCRGAGCVAWDAVSAAHECKHGSCCCEGGNKGAVCQCSGFGLCSFDTLMGCGGHGIQ